MQSVTRVAVPPTKPLLIYDGECNFCRLWVRRWQQTTGDRIEYLTFQDPAVGTRFPELPLEQCRKAVQLIESDGTVRTAAHAAIRALACNPQEQWLLRWYVNSPTFARLAEAAYRFIARHRQLFSALTRLGWGSNVERPAYDLTRSVFLRSLALIYLIAFVSLWVQVLGLIGSRGILPAELTIEAIKQNMPGSAWDRVHSFPTLCWFNASDRFLLVQCAAGSFLALLLLIGIAPAPCLFLLWGVYLSLATISREFLGFQWDNLLLETGFLAIFFAPLQWRPRWGSGPPPSRVVLWLLRWLLFRLMFESGCVKLLSGDPSWRELTALNVHYETQPLPTWLGWYAHQLPATVHKLSVLLMFALELGIPFLIFAPRRLRQFACLALLALQALIFATGNYCFFNLLTMALCLLLLDDFAFQKLIPSRCRASPTVSPPRGLRWPGFVVIPLACLILGISLLQLLSTFRVAVPWPRPVATVHRALAPFRSLNGYGLFSVMTISRPEIIVEGSNDGQHWLPYEFKYKPGDPARRPLFVAPHQPRLDWQMWFAALSNYRQNPWLVNLCVRLMQGSPDVLKLMERNPFPNAPPRYVRAVTYDYRFTDFAARGKTGAWWKREPQGTYLPVISLRQQAQPEP